jgi:hypothetical protein
MTRRGCNVLLLFVLVDVIVTGVWTFVGRRSVISLCVERFRGIVVAVSYVLCRMCSVTRLSCDLLMLSALS